MARREFRHNAQTYIVETFPLAPDRATCGCIVFRPNVPEQYFALASNIGPSGLPPFQVFADDRAGIEAAINTIRTLLPVSLLRRFMDQLEQAEIVAQDEQKKLVLSKIAFRDWRALRQSDWDAERWEGEDQALTCLDRDDESYLAALRRRLARMGIVDVVVTDDVEYMGIAPA